MNMIFNIEATIEPIRETETRVSFSDGDFRAFEVNGYQGYITLQSETDEFHERLIWRIRKCPTPKDVVQAEITMLENMQSDIGDLIAKLKQE